MKITNRIKCLTGTVLLFLSCTKLPVDLTEEDKINTYIPPEAIINWVKTFGGTDNDYFMSFDKTSDGGYIFIGSTSSYGAGSNDVYLLKTNTDGDIEWYKTFGGVENDNGVFVRQTKDGGYLITGDSRSSSNGGSDLYLIRTDNAGIKIWERMFGGLYSDFGRGILSLPDSTYIISGIAYSSMPNTGYLIRINDSGDTLWTKVFNGYAYQIKQVSDSFGIIAGVTDMRKIDFAGNIKWIAVVNCIDFAKSGDNSYYALSGNNISRILDDGSVAWTKAYVDSLQYCGQSIASTGDGNFIVTGYVKATVSDIFIIKLNSSGNILHKTVFAGAGEGHCILQNSDGSYVIGGMTNPLVPNTDTRDALIIKTKPENNWR
jgi:hypothetical protein